MIQNFLQDLENGKEPDSEIDNLKSTIDENMIALQNPTSDYTEAYASLVEIYGIYIQIYDQSKNPSGSLLTFNSAVKDLSSQFESSYGQLKVLKPEIEQQVKEKMQESDDAI